MAEIVVKAVDFKEEPLIDSGESTQSGEQNEGNKGDENGEGDGGESQGDDSQDGAKGVSDGSSDDAGSSDDDDLDDQKVISWFAKKHNKTLGSIDELLKEPSAPSVDDMLPSDVAAFYKFKKETGRGLEDFVKVNRSFENEPQDKVLKEYIRMANPSFDEDEVDSEYNDRFGFDADDDDPAEIKRKKRELKKEYGKALEFFNSQKQQYSIPVESTGAGKPAIEDEDYKEYQTFISKQSQEAELARKRSEAFVSKTNEVFSNESKGFEFNVGDKSIVWKPSNLEKAKSDHLNISSSLSKFVDKETGIIKDAVGYHKSMAMAMNPDYFANFFYEQGRAAAIEASATKDKNIQQVRNAPQDAPKGGMVVRAIEDGNNSSGRIVIKKNS